MEKNIIFRMVAYTDPAGKFSKNAPRNGNEDNFYVDDNLSDDQPNHYEQDKEKTLAECGLIMVVADGMGGMNAGEVASEIAVNTVQDFFAPGKVTAKIAESHHSRKEYMEHVIEEADKRIKADSKHNPEHQGMGSTIIMAWLVEDELTLSWCGDSRAYRYNPAFGIELLSKDHSYVQELVDKGIIRYEDTFDHPQGNIVTRSLGDVSTKARPESRAFQVYTNDIILLCSDGLSGVLRDRKTYDTDGELIEGDNLEDIIGANLGSLVSCREALWKAAEKADWYDNVTAVLCEIRSGAKMPEKKDVIKKDTPIVPTYKEHQESSCRKKGHLKALIIALIALFAVLYTGVIVFASWSFFEIRHKKETTEVRDLDQSEVDVQEKETNKFVELFEDLRTRVEILREEVPFVGKQLDIVEDHLRLAKANQDLLGLNQVQDEVGLWEQKVPYLKKSKMLLDKVGNNVAKKRKIKNIMNEICSAKIMDEKYWEKSLDEVTKESEQKTEKIEEKASEIKDNPDLTPIDDSSIQKEYTILDTDEWEVFCKQIEKNNPGYEIDNISTKKNGIIIDRESSFNLLREQTEKSERCVVVRMKKKK